MARSTKESSVYTDKKTYNTGRIDTISMATGPKKDRAELMKELERRKARDRELVVGMFKNLENPGGGVSFSYYRYKGDNYEKYSFADGEVYQIPRGVARWLQKECYSLEYKHLPGNIGQFGMRGGHTGDGMYGNSKMVTTRKLHRFQFNNLDYLDDDADLYAPKELYQVSQEVTL
jgi:hypothetical protein